ncbi:hypothetical protein Q5H93_21000 [Hymenobacter sp. ASUV-10]|uniref:Uncharacterized protein n=1 Tax=Hymenobacter aranciens TaxID=3063996 RepID=A0ABT9BG66_9BACT|nr:hypothetical protein [Hymenobacter sp. ASUV-10]MDO7877237.1 hypothetical protein [Hymenobacter sp. ASUV-10]
MPTPNEPKTRQSGISDADLVADGRRLLVAARRDLPLLTDDGVDADRLDKLEKDIKAFELLPSDTVDEATQAAETQVRDAAVNTLQDAIRAVAGPVIDVYGLKSPRYRALGIVDLEGKNDAELLRAATDCHAAGTRLLTDADVVREGLTLDKLAAIGPARQALVDVLDQRTRLQEQRSLNAQARVRAHNPLNDEITRIQGKCQRKFRGTDSARYDDYVRQSAPGNPDGESPVKPPQ